MSIEALPDFRVEVTAGKGEPHHTWCCDEDVALCGLGLDGGHVYCPEDCGCAPCKLCWYILEENLPCPVPGCVP